MAKEILGYARVSTKEQNLERQLVELRRYVPKAKNIISDKQSGKDFERTGYKSLKERVREGDELYVKSIYRLGRDKDAIKNELRFFKDKGIIVHTPSLAVVHSSTQQTVPCPCGSAQPFRMWNTAERSVR